VTFYALPVQVVDTVLGYLCAFFGHTAQVTPCALTAYKVAAPFCRTVASSVASRGLQASRVPSSDTTEGPARYILYI